MLHPILSGFWVLVSFMKCFLIFFIGFTTSYLRIPLRSWPTETANTAAGAQPPALPETSRARRVYRLRLDTCIALFLHTWNGLWTCVYALNIPKLYLQIRSFQRLTIFLWLNFLETCAKLSIALRTAQVSSWLRNGFVEPDWSFWSKMKQSKFGRYTL